MYLIGYQDIWLLFHLYSTKGFDCYADANLYRNWTCFTADVDPDTANSWSGRYILYANCPIILAFKLQTQVALITTKAEYIALSSALRDVIPIMSLVEEIKSKVFPIFFNSPHVFFKAFEDNSGALELARLPKLLPKTKHINVCYHHFCEHVRKDKIKIFPIGTDQQPAEIAKKKLSPKIYFSITESWYVVLKGSTSREGVWGLTLATRSSLEARRVT